MSKTKRNAILIIFFAAIAIAGGLNIRLILKEQIPFYKSATIHTVNIDSISLISADPAYGIYAIIGYGNLAATNNFISVDLTEGVDINAFSRGEAYAFKGQEVEVYVNAKFERARLKIKEKAEINYLNKRNLLLYSICLIPLLTLISFWIVKRK